MKFPKVIGMVILLLVANQAAAQNWRTCANEDEYCRFSGEKRVAYGAGNQWTYQTARNGIACNNRTFGDPVPGVRKSCRYVERVASVVRCAREGDFCSFRGTREVRYGADGRWARGMFSNGVECSNRVFGDPAPNVVKSCVYDNVGDAPHRNREERQRDHDERQSDEGGGSSRR